MVRKFEGAGATEESVGRHTGLLTSATPAAQVLTSFLWGTLLDTLGKKPVLMMANAAAALSLVALGWSSNLMCAILISFLGGIFTSGNGVVIRSMVAEAGSAAQQAKTMSYSLAGWGVGTVIGPLIGGVLASPCMAYGNTFPFCGDGQVLASRPFLLPLLVSGALATLACLQNLCMMVGRQQQRCRTENVSLQRTYKENMVVTGNESVEAVRPPLGGIVQLAKLQGDRQHGQMRMPGQEHYSTLAASSLADSAQLYGVEEENAALLQEVLSSTTDASQISGGSNGQQQSSLCGDIDSNYPSWYKNGSVLTCLLGSAICTSACSYLDGLLPLLASASIPMGGLGLPTQGLSMPMAFGGVSLALYSLFVYPMQQKACGVYVSLQMGLIAFMPIAMLIPFSTTYASTAPTVSMAVLLLTIGFRSIAKTSIMSSSTVLINLVAPLAQVGAVNGAGQMMQSLGRSLAPILAGYAWGLAMSLPNTYSGRQYIPFVGVLLGSSISLCLYSMVRSKVT